MEIDSLTFQLRESGHNEAGCNCIARAVDTYLHWLAVDGRDIHCGLGCNHPKMRKLKEPVQVMPTYAPEQINKLIHWKPRTKGQKRIHLLTLFLLDTGYRISEALGLHVADIDLQNLLVLLDGKERKQRLVPFSQELRRVIYKHIQTDNLTPDDYLFETQNGTALRDVSSLCHKLRL